MPKTKLDIFIEVGEKMKYNPLLKTKDNFMESFNLLNDGEQYYSEQEVQELNEKVLYWQNRALMGSKDEVRELKKTIEQFTDANILMLDENKKLQKENEELKNRINELNFWIDQCLKKQIEKFQKENKKLKRRIYNEYK